MEETEELQVLKKITKQVEHIRDTQKTELDKMRIEVQEMHEDVSRAKESGGSSGFGRIKSLGALAVQLLKDAGLNSSLEKGGRKTVTINKVAGTFTTGNVIPVGDDAIAYSLAEREGGLSRTVRRRPFIIEIANTRPTNKGYIQWAELSNPDGTAGPTAEGAKKNQIDFDWIEKSAKVEKVTGFIKVSKESLDDLDSLRSDIDIELRELVLLAADVQLLSGNGTSPQLLGLLAQDTPYAAGAFAGTVVAPNYFDVLRTAISQIVQENFSPNYILMNPVDVATMDLTKSEVDEHYLLPPFKAANGQEISGVRIIENNGIAQGNFEVGDFRLFNVRVREGFTISVGFENDDFTKNLLTILGEIRLVCYVKNVHQKAFVGGSFATAIAALEGGS